MHTTVLDGQSQWHSLTASAAAYKAVATSVCLLSEQLQLALRSLHCSRANVTDLDSDPDSDYNAGACFLCRRMRVGAATVRQALAAALG